MGEGEKLLIPGVGIAAIYLDKGDREAEAWVLPFGQQVSGRLRYLLSAHLPTSRVHSEKPSGVPDLHPV